MNCAGIEKLLGAWCDGELESDEADQVQHHLALCPSCRRRQVQLERFDRSIRTSLQERGAQAQFDAAWPGIERRIAEAPSRRGGFGDWARLAFEAKHLRWAVSAAALVIAILSFPDSYYKERLFGSGGGRTGIESIDAHGQNVAVFRERRTRTTVIWLFQNEERDDEVQEESNPNNRAL